MYYFAYGSNMATRIMQQWCDQFEIIGPAQLQDYRLAFTLPSKRWGHGAADVVGAAGESAWGVLYNLDVPCSQAMDEKERLGVAYAHLQCAVRLPGGQIHHARTYSVIDKADSELRPARAYKDVILEGALEHGLPTTYVDWLRRIPISRETQKPGR